MFNRKYLFGLLYFIVFICVNAQTEQKYADLGDFKLENGDTIKDCKIGYRTYGNLDKNKSNIVLFPTFFNGTSKANERNLGAGKLIDTLKYYVISIDAIGNGISTSPNNSVRQPNNQFPYFTITDMVNSQYAALTKCLGIDHVFCVLGGSMASMQTYEWLVTYPSFMDKAIPYVPTPYLTSHDKFLWSIALEVIKIGEEYNVPDKNIAKLLMMMISFSAHTSANLNRTVPVEKFDDYLKRFDGEASKIFPPINWKYQLISMINHNITKKFNFSKEETAKIIKAKVLAIIGLSDDILNPASAIEFSKIAKLETLLLDNDCGHGAVGCEMEKVSNAIAKFLDEK
ncbi:MAG: alpha/beta fold hydrolase [bacterium]